MYPVAQQVCVQRMIMDDQVREATTKGMSIFVIFLKISIIEHTIIFSVLDNRKDDV